jgi:hypothetical protein
VGFLVIGVGLSGTSSFNKKVRGFFMSKFLMIARLAGKRNAKNWKLFLPVKNKNEKDIVVYCLFVVCQYVIGSDTKDFRTNRPL